VKQLQQLAEGGCPCFPLYSPLLTMAVCAFVCPSVCHLPTGYLKKRKKPSTFKLRKVTNVRLSKWQTSFYGNSSKIKITGGGNVKVVLPRDAMYKRGLCRNAVSVCLSVRLSRSFILLKRTTTPSNFLHSRVATLF